MIQSEQAVRSRLPITANDIGAPTGGRVKRFKWTIGACVALALLHVIWLLTKAGGEATVTAASDLIQLVAPTAAAIMCGIRARREAPGHRLAWALLAASMAAWSAGTATWCIYEVILRVDVP